MDELTARLNALSPEQRKLLNERLVARGYIPRRLRPGPARLSYAQESIWLTEQAGVGVEAFQLRASVTLEGHVEIEALAAAVRDLLTRHEILRSRFVVSGSDPVQEVLDPRSDILRFFDLSARESEERLARLLAEEASRPLSLATGEVVRVVAVRLAPTRHLVLLAVHHIASDEASWNILLRDLEEFYIARVSGVALVHQSMPIQFADYAEWERSSMMAGRFDAQRSFWQKTLARLGDTQERHFLSGVQTGFSLATERRAVEVSPNMVDALEGLAHRAGATRFMVLLTALFVVMAQATGQRDLVVGSFVSTRRSPVTDQVIGLFLNPAAIRVVLPDNPTMDEILACVREAVIGAQANGAYPFEPLVDFLGFTRQAGRLPVFQTIFAQREEAPRQMEFAGMNMHTREFETTSSMSDLTFSVRLHRRNLICTAQFRLDAISSDRAERLLADYVRVLEVIALEPHRRLNMLDLGLGVVLPVVDGGTKVVPGSGFHDLVLAQAARTPEAVAIEGLNGSLSYADLAVRSGLIADALIRRGLAPEEKVAVSLDPGPDLIAVLLGIARAGLTYVPIDPRRSEHHLLDRVEHSDARILVATGEAPTVRGRSVLSPARLMSEGEEVNVPQARVEGAQAAYVVFTSGSTGEPKGVVVTHEAMSNFLLAMRDILAPTAADRVLAITPISFDISALELFLPLIVGARLVVARPQARIDPDLLIQFISEKNITFAQGTPSFWSMVLAGGWRGKPDMTVLCGGEALPTSVGQSLCVRCKATWNLYGPTETTIWSTAAQLMTPLTRVTIGLPIANTRICVVDERLRALPAGVVGELCISGIGLARGYLSRPDLTASRFVPDPAGGGGRLYRTGDRAVRGEDGGIAVLGRTDGQVKIRGHRVELAEIEAILLSHPEVRGAAVLAVSDKGFGARLVAHVSANADEADIRKFLSERLPIEIVPSVRMWSCLPQNSHGKIDRALLGGQQSSVAQQATEPPRTGLEEAVAAIWMAILGVGSVRRSDNFFHLGGHSLSGASMMARVGQMLGRTVPLRILFENPNLDQFAEALSLESDAREPLATNLRPLELARYRLSFAQETVWRFVRAMPDASFLNISVVAHLEGQLDMVALEKAVACIVARHPPLRSRIEVEDDQVWVVEDRCAPRLQTVNMGVFPTQLRTSEVSRAVRWFVERPFQFKKEPLIRFAMVQTDAVHTTLTLAAHHLVADGWSLNLICRELGDAYKSLTAGREPEFQSLPVSYGDFAEWQRENYDRIFRPKLAWWLDRLDRPFAPMRLAGDRLPTDDNRLARLSRTLSASSVSQFRERARERGWTLYEGLLGVLAAILYDASGHCEARIGAVFSGRSHPSLDGLFGMFSNTLPISTTVVADLSFESLMQSVRRSLLDVHDRQDVPMALILRELGTRNCDPRDIMPVMLSFHQFTAWRSSREDLVVTQTNDFSNTPEFVSGNTCLMFEIFDTGTDLILVLDYKAQRFPQPLVLALIDHYEQFMERAAVEPDVSLEQLISTGLSALRPLGP